MAEVHEITRSALDGLMARGVIFDEHWGHGDYLVMSYLAEFGRTSPTVFLSERWETERRACYSVDRWNHVGLINANVHGGFCNVYEVWHVVDDADDDGWEDDLDELLMSGLGSAWRSSCDAVDALETDAETLESLRQFYEAGALDGVKPLHDDLSSHVTEGGKPKNWHIQYSFDELKREGISGDRAIFIKNFMWEHRNCGRPLHKCLSGYLDYCVELFELDDIDDEEIYHSDKGSINCNSLDEAYDMAACLSSMPYFSKVEILVWIHNCETTNHLVLYQFEKKRGQVKAYAEFGCHLLDIDVPESISGIAVELGYNPF